MDRLPRIRRYADRRAATAVEFALVCAPLMILILAIFETGLHYYQQHVLDYATQTAVRQVQLGHVPASSTEADFLSGVLCPALGPLQSCTNVFVDLRPVTDYQQLTNPGVPDAPDNMATTGFVFCAGKPGQLMYAHVVYLSATIGGSLLSSASIGSDAIISNAAFANENPTGVAVVQVNGC